MGKRVLALWFFLSWNTLTLAADEPREVFLITLGAGTKLSNAAGHSLLRIKSARSDLIHQWGVLPHEGLRFYYQYFQRYPTYGWETVSTKDFQASFLADEARFARQDKLRLTAEEIDRIQAQIAVWQRPEHRYFEYREFDNNCSTIIRDILDKALEGRFKAALQTTPSSMTRRDFWHQYFSAHALPQIALEPLWNGEFDEPMRAWDTMFLPLQLSSQLSQQGLIAETHIIADQPYTRGSPIDFNWFFGLFFGCLSALHLGFGKRRTLALLLAAWAIVASVFGMAMVFHALMSNRSFLKGSLYAAVFWPWDIVLLMPALTLWRGRLLTPRWTRILRLFWRSHLLGCAVLLILLGLGFSKQDMSSLLPIASPLLLVFIRANFS